MRFIVPVVFLLIAPLAMAAQESEFAYGYTLEVDGDGAIYSLSLPEAVYRGLTRVDDGDLRVFNSHGESVPHHIQRSTHPLKSRQADISLPLFPLYREEDTQAANNSSNVHIVTNDKGAIIDINYGKPAENGERTVSAYLLDGSQMQQAPAGLVCNWPADTEDFVTNVSVDGSNDLTHWSTLVARSTLSNLHYGQHTLIQKRISLPLHQYKYLRLNWLGSHAIALDGVMAQFPDTYQSQERKWASFDVSEFDSKDNVYIFDTHSLLPADRLNISLPGNNVLVSAVVESASSQQGPWYPRYRGLLYQLRYEGSTLSTPDQTTKIVRHRYWRVRLLGQESRLDGKPVLRLGWVPETLYFVAQGEAPFTLAYGSARVGPVDTPLASLMNMEKMRDTQHLVKPAQLGSPIQLGNKNNLRPAGAGVDWNKLLLWMILILGVGVLAYMVMRLYKQMDQTGPKE